MNIKKKLRQASQHEAFLKKCQSLAPKRKEWAKKCIEFKKITLSNSSTQEEQGAANFEIVQLMKLREKTSKFSMVRYYNRCKVSARRTKGLRLGGTISRHVLRQYASLGFVVGIKKV